MIFNSLQEKITTKKNKDNKLSDVFKDGVNPIGKTFISIYYSFVKLQKDELNNLLDIKMRKDILNVDSGNS